MMPKPGPLTACLLEADPFVLAEMMVAFANGDGGSIVVGKDSDGNVSNSQIYVEELEGALHQAEQLCRPVIQTGWEQFESEDGTVFVVRVVRSPELHALSDGRVLIRAGAENRPLSGDEIRLLAGSKSTGEFESETVAGATTTDFDDHVISEYVQKLESRRQKSISRNTDEILLEAGAITRDGIPTIAGMLLFGSESHALLPQSGLVFVRFIGTDPRGSDGKAGYGRREEINGPLARVVENTWNVIHEEMTISAVVEGLEREEKPEYPPFAVREALVNAVCHRDYRLQGRRVEVRMFADRMEVISPGGLPGFITVDNIVDEHFSRNPRVVKGLFQWGYIEELGLGIDRMIESMVQAGHPPPEFKARPHAFTVTLYNNRSQKIMPKWQGNMNERQMRAVEHIQTNGRIANREYQQLCPDVSPETLRLDLSDMVDKGLLLKIGANKGTYYILK
jgi:ATP-dependent DNA helicase RecG